MIGKASRGKHLTMPWTPGVGFTTGHNGTCTSSRRVVAISKMAKCLSRIRTDEHWVILDPLFAALNASSDKGGRPWRGNRECLEGVGSGELGRSTPESLA